MKKKLVLLLALLMLVIAGPCRAATYTLPEKMYNQLAIGSGLKGTFTVTAEGERFRTPLMDAITDAEWSLRGIRSGEDLHYYLFQAGENEEQNALTEVYKKDGIYYLRSDMVQGKTLAFPVLSQVLDSLFPAKGENGSSSSFVTKILTLPENTRKDQWEPVMQRYQNELEMWLANYAKDAPVVKLENGLSALDFTYEIPMEDVFEQIGKLYKAFAADPEVSALLDTVMSEEEKAVYVNGNLIYFYLESLKATGVTEPVRISKRVTATGEMLSFSIDLPLDEKTSGYQLIQIKSVKDLTIYTLQSSKETIAVGVPDLGKLKQAAFEQSVWFAWIRNEDPDKQNIAVRIDIRKTNEVSEREEKTNEINRYLISVTEDTTYLPEGTDLSLLPDFEPIEMDILLHYSSKYAQNSATTLEISADIREGDSALQLSGKMKTAAPWLFMPFEVIDPVQTGTAVKDVLEPYLTDWISNAASMIRHSDTAITEESAGAPAETEPQMETETPEETEAAAETEETEETEVTEDQGAETAPMDIAEQE